MKKKIITGAVPYESYPTRRIMSQPGLTMQHKLLLLSIHWLDKLDTHAVPPVHLGCFASNAWLAFELGESKGVIRNLISELEALGYLKINGAKGRHGAVYRRVVCPCPAIAKERWEEQVYLTTPEGRHPRTRGEVQAFLRELGGVVNTSHAHPGSATTPGTQAPRSPASEQPACSKPKQAACSSWEQHSTRVQKNEIGAKPGNASPGNPIPDPSSVPGGDIVTPGDVVTPLINIPAETIPSPARPTVNGEPGSVAPTVSRVIQEFNSFRFARRLLDTFNVVEVTDQQADLFMNWWNRGLADEHTFEAVLQFLGVLSAGNPKERARFPVTMSDLLARFEVIAEYIARHTADLASTELQCVLDDLAVDLMPDGTAGKMLIERCNDMCGKFPVRGITSFEQYVKHAKNPESGSDPEMTWVAACHFARLCDSTASRENQFLRAAVLQRCVTTGRPEVIISLMEKMTRLPFDGFCGLTIDEVKKVREHCEAQVNRGQQFFGHQLPLAVALRATKHFDVHQLGHLVTQVVEGYVVSRDLPDLVGALITAARAGGTESNGQLRTCSRAA